MHMAKKDIPRKDPAATATGVSRRDFIKGGVIAGVAGGVGLGAAYFGYGASVRNPVRVGIIGTGDEGSVLIGAINPNYIDVVAIADIRPYNIHRAFHGDDSSESTRTVRPGLLKKYGWTSEGQARKHVRVYEDGYDGLLNNPDVEAVIIALPLHLHAPASIAAMQKGKHVLCEKLMAHSVGQCKDMAQVAEKTGKLLAVGHQRHYSVLYDNAAETIRRGLIGQVHHIRAQWFRGNLPGKDTWQPDLPGEDMQKKLAEYQQEAQDALDKLDKLWQESPRKWSPGDDAKREQAAFALRQKALLLMDLNLEAAKYGYEERTVADKKISALEELIRWRLWNRTGGGLMAELGSHQLDAASIFISAMREDKKKVHPLTVTAVGGRHIFPHDRDIEDHVYCMYEFPGLEYYSDFDKKIVGDKNKKVVVTYSSINGNGFGGYGEIVMGTKGTLIVEREQDMSLISDEDKATSIQAAKGGSGPTLDTTESGGYKAARKLGGGGPVSRGYTEEIEHWAWCIRNPAPENRPRCHPEVALADAVIALTSNIAMRNPQLRGSVDFNPKWFDIHDPATPEEDLKDASGRTAS